MGDVSDVPFCITNTIDKHSNIGRQYYHNISVPDFNTLTVRPRIPVRYDFHDAEAVRLNTATEANRLLKRRDLTDTEVFHHITRTTRSKVNTLLSNVLAVILIIASIVNMNRILRALRDDATLTGKDRALFQVGFFLSFAVVLFLACYLTMAWFELYRSRHSFREVRAHGFRYIDLGNGAHVARLAVSVIVLVLVADAVAETLNLFFANDQAIMFLMLPIVACLLLLVRAFTTMALPPPPPPLQNKTAAAAQQQQFHTPRGEQQ